MILLVRQDGSLWKFRGIQEGPSCLSHMQFMGIDASDDFILLSRTGEVWIYDSINLYHIPTPHKVVSVACGGRENAGNSFFIITDSGDVYTRNTLQGLGNWEQLPQLSKIVSLSCGYSHMLALNSSGVVFSWGTHLDGECGQGWSEEIISSPTPIKFGLEGVNVLGISSGLKFSLALTTTGDVFSWGWGEYGKLGHGRGETLIFPQKIESLANIEAIACFRNHSLVVNGKGDVFGWGCGEGGRLGLMGEEGCPVADNYRVKNVFVPMKLNLRRFITLSPQSSLSSLRLLSPLSLHWTTHCNLYSHLVNILFQVGSFLIWYDWKYGRCFSVFPWEILEKFITPTRF
eukprot:TRINITY_DN4409_c0_g1_i2.p1 TRINITY_DN4409_c0_g1~~TRINITY_DN4409_c0_g1_i2.p1  ORF type:complete len:345 (+),score=72.81 TRINITY_DN4409_c0_g1_i2:571-1605(+)